MRSGAGRTIAYDGENRPVEIDGVAFVYGPDGERLKKIAGGVATLYLGDDVEITGAETTKYLPGGAKRVNSATYWLHKDHLGSTRAVTNASGAEEQRLNYRPYGERLSTATGFVESKSWIGERQDAETGLFYLHARYYDPVLGRFISADPSDPWRPGVGINRYAYAGNNPVMMLDPEGLSYGPEGGTADYGDDDDESDGEGAERTDNETDTQVAGKPPHQVYPAMGRALNQRRIHEQSLPPNPNAHPSAPKTTSPAKTSPPPGKTPGSKTKPEAPKNRAESLEKGVPPGEIGPSGKPKHHIKKHPNRKRAKDKANERSPKGTGPEQHKNPTEGEPHFHPGGKKHREHHTYPGRGFPRNERY